MCTALIHLKHAVCIVRTVVYCNVLYMCNTFSSFIAVTRVHASCTVAQHRYKKTECSCSSPSGLTKLGWRRLSMRHRLDLSETFRSQKGDPRVYRMIHVVQKSPRGVYRRQPCIGRTEVPLVRIVGR
ncbi:unnamed protein product [Chondrus crispus]|uniref:Uncharacterized protein n=1 Tax=Chondrus crispus TaxID=2769 RepID=R7QDJ4_CHOCR|nr:unnamed protein product [Chondrus crispus]CDF36587.1 unnamed protein product [Chondrus crispus]|eukprot:XP_005716406.1 unnamed protein product [Chondrus crispus]